MKLIILLTFVWIFLEQAFGKLSVSIETDPPGPIYIAATWIHFNCIVDERAEEPITYHWYKWCSYTGKLMFIETWHTSWWPYQVLTTPTSCWDGMRCLVVDSKNETGYGNVSFHNIIGVSLRHNETPIKNSSTVITKQMNSFGEIYCHSGSRTNSTPGYWILPDDTILNATTDTYNYTTSGEMVPRYISLSHNPAVVFMEGLYQCVIPDENDILQIFHVWIFNEEFNGMPSLQYYYSATTEPFQLLCVFHGAPGTVQWFVNESLITTNDIYNIDTIILNVSDIVYLSVLTVYSNTTLDWAGDYKCDFQTHFVYEEEHMKTVKSCFYFFVYPVGEHHTVLCPFNDASSTVCATKDGQILIPEQHGILEIEFNPIRDIDHERIFGCHKNCSGDIQDLYFTIVGLEPHSVLSIAFPELPITRSGDPVHLECIISKIVPGFENFIDIFWLGSNSSTGFLLNIEGASINTTLTNSNQTLSRLSINHFNTSQAGIYTCIGFLDTKILAHPIPISKEQVLAVHIAPPILSMTTSTSESVSDIMLLAGSSSEIKCTANISSSIDTPITVETQWYLGSDTQPINNTDITTVTSTTLISEFTYESTLHISPVLSSFINGSIECKVMLINDNDQNYYVVSNEERIKKSVKIIDPDLSVTIIPQELTVPDQPPYNMFTLTCMVSGLEYLAIEPFVNWLSGETNSTYNYTVNIVNNETTWYVLHIENKTAGNFEYRCEVNLPDDSMFVYTTTAIVSVKGPTLPNPPVDLTITAKHAQEVIVEWFVTKISYTPEIYTVQYGIEEDELVYFSSINSSDDITLTGQMFNLKLTGLRGNTKYYYRLLTTNSFASVVSSTKTFTTPQHSLGIEISPVSPVTAGSPQSLTCTVTVAITNSLLFPPSVIWYSPDRQIITNTSNWTTDSMITNDNTITITLSMSQVRTSQAGLYTCEATLSNGEILTVEEFLIVEIPYTISDSLSPPTPPGIYTGHNVNLTCKLQLSRYVDTNVTIATSWKHNNIQLHPTSKLQILPVHKTNEDHVARLLIDTVDGSFEGTYKCEMIVRDMREEVGAATVLPATVSAIIYLEVRDLPEHNITIVTTGNQTAGEHLTLSCLVTPTDSLLDTPMLMWIGPITNKSLNGPFIQNGIMQLELEFTPLKASDGGSYVCRAVSVITSLGLMKDTNLMKDLIVYLPRPTLFITLSPSQKMHYAGSTLNITCTVNLAPEIDVEMTAISSWKKDGNILASTTRIATYDLKNSIDNSLRGVLVFETLSTLMDNGEYECLMLVSSTPFSLVIAPAPPVSITIEIEVHEPPLELLLSPLSLTILDTPHHNTFMLRCQVNTPPEILSEKGFTWRNLQDGSSTFGTPITNITKGFSIEEFNFDNGSVVNVLSGSLNIAGMYHFICEAMIDIKEDLQPAKHLEAAVLVKGPHLPVPVTNITSRRGPTLDSTYISWIAQLSYTPEVYIIHYGSNKNSLDFTSGDINSVNDTMQLNNSYEVIISGLEVGETVYFKISSNNSVGGAESEVMNFTAGFNSLLFQLGLTGINECTEWVFSNPSAKKAEVIDGISNAIETTCNCNFPPDHIFEGHFVCIENNPSDVLFRGRIYGTTENEPSSLLESLEEWANDDSSSLVVASIRLSIDNTCVRINSSLDPECPDTPNEQKKGKSDNLVIIFIIVGIFAVVLFAIVCVVILIYVVYNRLKKQAKRREQESMRMREILRATSAPLSPLTRPPNDILDEKGEYYMSPKPTFPESRYPKTPPPHYMSPRSMDKQRQTTPSKERDSHIYYLNTPPLPSPYLPPARIDPIYEPIPGDDCYQSPKLPITFKPPEVPEIPPARKRSVSQEMILQEEVTKEEMILQEEVTKEEMSVGEFDGLRRENDHYEYMEMNSAGPVDFGSATI